MFNLTVMMEICGISTCVGHITGTDSSNSFFSYDDIYLSTPDCRSISISLPIEKKHFSPEETKCFFEGLLPEGFTRRCVAERLCADESDYLTLLSVLGSECLGAIKIVDPINGEIKAAYRPLEDHEITALAAEGASESAEFVSKSHLSLTGASGKVGLYYDYEKHQWYLPIGDAPSTHIIKQSHVRLKRIVANEQLCLLTAKNVGIDVPNSFILQLNGSDDADILFATERYDRKMQDSKRMLNHMPVPYRLHQEDFSQALGIAAINKYEKNGQHYLKRMFDTIRKNCSDPLHDQLKLWDLCVFNYLIGNTDNHIKNVSLLYSEDLRSIHIAPAYDIVSTVVYERSTENMAFSIDGIYDIRQISRDHFANEAKLCGLGAKMALRRFDDMVDKFADALNHATNDLDNLGFHDARSLSHQILDKGGIHHYI